MFMIWGSAKSAYTFTTVTNSEPCLTMTPMIGYGIRADPDQIVNIYQHDSNQQSVISWTDLDVALIIF